MTQEAGGFAIDEVEMSGFMRYVEKKQRVELPPGFTVITGKTGAGKSTILDAVTFALYGNTTRTDPPQNIKAAELFQPGGHVRVSFRQAGHRYDVRRGFTARKSSTLELEEDGRSLGGTIPEKDKIIVNIVGLDYLGFRNSTFVRQEEMKELGSELGSKRLEIFQKLFRLETFEKAQDAAKEAYAEVEEQAHDMEKELEVRREHMARLPEVEKELQEAKENLEGEGRESEKLKGELEEAQSGLKGKEAAHEEFVRLATRAAESENRLATVTKRAEKARKEAEKSIELRSRVEALEGELKDYEKLRDETESLKEAQRKYDLLKKDKDAAIQRKRDAEAEHDVRLKSIRDRLFNTERRIASLRTDLGKDEAFGLLRTEGALGERIHRIEMELEWLAERAELVSRLKDEKTRASEEFGKVSERVDRINEDVFRVSELRLQVEEAKAEIRREDETFTPRLAGLEEEVQRTLDALKESRFTESDEKRLGEVNERVGRLRSRTAELEQARAKLKEVGDAARLVTELDEQKATVESEVDAAKRAVEKAGEAEEAFVKAKEVVDGLRAKAEKAARQLGAQEGRCKELSKQIEQLKTEEKTIGELAKSLKGLQDRREILAILKDEVFHKKGVVMFAVNHLLPALESETSANLADLTDGRFSKVRLETYEEARGHGIRMSVEGVDGQWHDVGEFSGGERTQINAALRFAIARQLASMPQIGGSYGRMKTLFIDEGDLGSLDTEVSRDLFVQKLFKMGDFFDKVILITHLTEVAEKFPSRMHVTMNERGESRVEVVS